MGSYSKPNAKTAPDLGLRPPLPFISETPVFHPQHRHRGQKVGLENPAVGPMIETNASGVHWARMASSELFNMVVLVHMILLHMLNFVAFSSGKRTKLTPVAPLSKLTAIKWASFGWPPL